MSDSRSYPKPVHCTVISPNRDGVGKVAFCVFCEWQAQADTDVALAYAIASHNRTHFGPPKTAEEIAAELRSSR